MPNDNESISSGNNKIENAILIQLNLSSTSNNHINNKKKKKFKNLDIIIKKTLKFSIMEYLHHEKDQEVLFTKRRSQKIQFMLK